MGESDGQTESPVWEGMVFGFERLSVSSTTLSMMGLHGFFTNKSFILLHIHRYERLRLPGFAASLARECDLKGCGATKGRFTQGPHRSAGNDELSESFLFFAWFPAV